MNLEEFPARKKQTLQNFQSTYWIDVGRYGWDSEEQQLAISSQQSRPITGNKKKPEPESSGFFVGWLPG
jgi:hypothetical protein